MFCRFSLFGYAMAARVLDIQCLNDGSKGEEKEKEREKGDKGSIINGGFRGYHHLCGVHVKFFFEDVITSSFKIVLDI